MSGPIHSMHLCHLDELHKKKSRERAKTKSNRKGQMKLNKTTSEHDRSTKVMANEGLLISVRHQVCVHVTGCMQSK